MSHEHAGHTHDTEKATPAPTKPVERKVPHWSDWFKEWNGGKVAQVVFLSCMLLAFVFTFIGLYATDIQLCGQQSAVNATEFTFQPSTKFQLYSNGSYMRGGVVVKYDPKATLGKVSVAYTYSWAPPAIAFNSSIPQLNVTTQDIVDGLNIILQCVYANVTFTLPSKFQNQWTLSTLGGPLKV